MIIVILYSQYPLLQNSIAENNILRIMKLSNQRGKDMNENSVFLKGIIIMFLTLFIVGFIMPEDGIVGGSIVFMGINYLIYIMIKLDKIRNRNIKD